MDNLLGKAATLVRSGVDAVADRLPDTKAVTSAIKGAGEPFVDRLPDIRAVTSAVQGGAERLYSFVPDRRSVFPLAIEFGDQTVAVHADGTVVGDRVAFQTTLTEATTVGPISLTSTSTFLGLALLMNAPWQRRVENLHWSADGSALLATVYAQGLEGGSDLCAFAQVADGPGGAAQWRASLALAGDDRPESTAEFRFATTPEEARQQAEAWVRERLKL